MSLMPSSLEKIKSDIFRTTGYRNMSQSSPLKLSPCRVPTNLPMVLEPTHICDGILE